MSFYSGYDSGEDERGKLKRGAVAGLGGGVIRSSDDDSDGEGRPFGKSGFYGRYPGLAFDMRRSDAKLPDGCEIVGGSPQVSRYRQGMVSWMLMELMAHTQTSPPA